MHRKHLNELGTVEVIDLLHQSNVAPIGMEAAFKRHNITGETLSRMSKISDLNGIGLTKAHTKAIFARIVKWKSSGLPANNTSGFVSTTEVTGYTSTEYLRKRAQLDFILDQAMSTFTVTPIPQVLNHIGCAIVGDTFDIVLHRSILKAMFHRMQRAKMRWEADGAPHRSNCATKSDAAVTQSDWYELSALMRANMKTSLCHMERELANETQSVLHYRGPSGEGKTLTTWAWAHLQAQDPGNIVHYIRQPPHKGTLDHVIKYGGKLHHNSHCHSNVHVLVDTIMKYDRINYQEGKRLILDGANNSAVVKNWSSCAAKWSKYSLSTMRRGRCENNCAGLLCCIVSSAVHAAVPARDALCSTTRVWSLDEYEQALRYDKVLATMVDRVFAAQCVAALHRSTYESCA